MMLRKGRLALFFMAVMGFLTFAVGCGRTPSVTSAPPALWLVYAHAQAGPQILYARRYAPNGRPLGPAVQLGRLGLVAQTEVAARGPHGDVFITLGSQVVEIRGQRIVARRNLPPGEEMLSIKWLDHTLYGVSETLADPPNISIERWRQGRFQPVLEHLPQDITTLVSGLPGTLWVLSARPQGAQIREVVGGRTRYRTPPLVPQGTVGFGGQQPVLPYTRGSKQFGYYTGRLHSFSSVYQAVVSVTDTQPLWGLTIKGVVPFVRGRFRFSKGVPWPTRQATDDIVVGGGHPYVAIFDGFSQGTWFNVKTGRWGPRFQMKTPWWAVVRAASLGS